MHVLLTSGNDFGGCKTGTTGLVSKPIVFCCIGFFMNLMMDSFNLSRAESIEGGSNVTSFPFTCTKKIEQITNNKFHIQIHEILAESRIFASKSKCHPKNVLSNKPSSRAAKLLRVMSMSGFLRTASSKRTASS